MKHFLFLQKMQTISHKSREEAIKQKFSLIILMTFLILNISFCEENNKSNNQVTSNGTDINNGNQLTVDLTANSLKSMPTIQEPGKINPASLSGSLSASKYSRGTETPVVGEAVKNSTIQNIFRFECYWPNTEGSNYCPPLIQEQIEAGSIPEIVGGPKPLYEFSDGAIIGMIHHAKTYFAIPSGEVSSFDSSSTLSFVGSKDENKDTLATAVDGSRYIIMIDNFFDTITKSSVEENRIYLSRTWNEDQRYGTIPIMKYFNNMENNIYQSYLHLDAKGENPLVYALNNVKHKYIASSEYGCNGSRIILLINYTNNHFILKTGSSETSSSTTVIAGKGGFSFDSYEWNEGAYYASIQTDGSDTWAACVDNKTQTIIGDINSPDCSAVKSLFIDGETFDAAGFLELDSVEQADLKNFLTFVSDDSGFTTKQIPSACSDTSYYADDITVK